MALPCRLGGLGLINPESLCQQNESSVRMTNPVSENLVQGQLHRSFRGTNQFGQERYRGIFPTSSDNRIRRDIAQCVRVTTARYRLRGREGVIELADVPSSKEAPFQYIEGKVLGRTLPPLRMDVGQGTVALLLRPRGNCCAFLVVPLWRVYLHETQWNS